MKSEGRKEKNIFNFFKIFFYTKINKMLKRFDDGTVKKKCNRCHAYREMADYIKQMKTSDLKKELKICVRCRGIDVELKREKNEHREIREKNIRIKKIENEIGLY